VTCGETSSLSVHHITPLDQGGEWFALENLVTLCRRCHEAEEKNSKSGFLESDGGQPHTGRRERETQSRGASAKDTVHLG
jgi:5-methylcytosine-specific restriction endonuclease McrA